VETFAHPRQLVDNPRFESDRERALKNLVLDEIDAPIRNIINDLSTLPYCFTLQSCFGHFVHIKAPAVENLDPLPLDDIGSVAYRIAYVALCLQNSPSGERLLSALARIPSVAPGFVQFGSPGWFWERQVNSFALQVEPLRFAHQDQAVIDHGEALQIQSVRDQFFASFGDLVKSLHNEGVTA